MLGGCGEPKFAPLNPYLQAKQPLEFAIPDSSFLPLLIRGWEVGPVRTPAGTPLPLNLTTPDPLQVRVAWYIAGTQEPLQFSQRVQSVGSVSVSNAALGLTSRIEFSEDGRRVTFRLEGEAASLIEAKLTVDLGDAQLRGLAAMQEFWQPERRGMALHLPWQGQWHVEAAGEIAPLPAAGPFRSAMIRFDDADKRVVTLDWSESKDDGRDRGLDILTESFYANRALALLISSIPPVTPGPSMQPYTREEAADRTQAVWLVHADFAPGYLTDLEAEQARIEFLTYGLNAYRTLFKWGCLPDSAFTAAKPLFYEGMAQLDASSRSIELGTTLEERFREATLWTFAEENLAADYPDVRNRYAKQAHEARDDAQDELKRRVRVWRKTQEFLKDTTLVAEQYIGEEPDPDGYSRRQRVPKEPFVAPDTLALLHIVSRASVGWFETVDKKWFELTDLAWPIELAFARYQFDRSIRLRESAHWERAEAALLNPEHPGRLLESDFGAPAVASACAEVEFVVHSYLGIQPHWRGGKITFHPRLPEGWGRTRARVPFGNGELYVDYDFANRQAWIAANGLTREFICSIYMPTPTGALSQQFKLEPGDGPVRVTLIEEPASVFKLRFENASLPE